MCCRAPSGGHCAVLTLVLPPGAQPRVYLYHHFMSDEECDHIIKARSNAALSACCASAAAAAPAAAAAATRRVTATALHIAQRRGSVPACAADFYAAHRAQQRGEPGWDHGRGYQ